MPLSSTSWAAKVPIKHATHVAVFLTMSTTHLSRDLTKVPWTRQINVFKRLSLSIRSPACLSGSTIIRVTSQEALNKKIARRPLRSPLKTSSNVVATCSTLLRQFAWHSMLAQTRWGTSITMEARFVGNRSSIDAKRQTTSNLYILRHSATSSSCLLAFALCRVLWSCSRNCYSRVSVLVTLSSILLIRRKMSMFKITRLSSPVSCKTFPTLPS